MWMQLLVREVFVEVRWPGCSDIGPFDYTPVGLVYNNNLETMQVSKHVTYSIRRIEIMI